MRDSIFLTVIVFFTSLILSTSRAEDFNKIILNNAINECSSGNGKTCRDVAIVYQMKKNSSKELEYNTKSCELGFKEACELIKNKKGQEVKIQKDLFAPPTKKELADIKKEFSKKCKNGNKQACLSEEFENEVSITENSRSNDSFADLGGFSDDDLKKCQSGNLVICKKNYQNFLKHEQYSSALEFLNPACSKNDNDSCLYIGSYYAQTKQLKKSKTYFVKSCKANLYKGCLGAGLVSNSVEDKIKFFEKSCRGQESFGCDFLGDVYFNKKSFSLALDNYDRGCSMENSESCEKKCTALANMNTSAFTLDNCLKTSCDKGNQKSCEVRAVISNEINKSNNDHERKMKMIDTAIEESNRRNELYKGLLNAANQIGKSISGISNSSEESTDNYQYKSTSQEGYSSGGTLTCGMRPMPKIGCRIGRCVDGAWEQICDSSPELACGMRPIPKIGCRVGRCVDVSWEQICDSSPNLSCGIKPIPNIGCQVGRCVDGRWEQICN